MKTIILILAFSLSTLAGNPVTLAADTAGMVVELKEKYGGLVVDTVTVVSLLDGQYVTTRRTGETAWYPRENYSLRIIERVNKK